MVVNLRVRHERLHHLGRCGSRSAFLLALIDASWAAAASSSRRREHIMGSTLIRAIEQSE